MSSTKRHPSPTSSSYSPSASAKPEDSSYYMRISRMTIDKLGVRLYDTVSAVVAELVANGYDADADKVTIHVPLGTQLVKKGKKKNEWIDNGHTIEVVDDGHGMTPDEASMYFLEVGRERRAHPGQGPKSRKHKRPVMGRKGIGKLAPFGICRRIEVLSAGGAKTDQGYFTSHFVMDYARLVSDSDEPVPLEAGAKDRTYSANHGTTIRLSHFLGKRVPDEETFLRQLARRFAPTKGFSISVVDTKVGAGKPCVVGPLNVPIQQVTKIDLSTRPVTTDDGEVLNVTGWLALARDAYKDEETTGVRIYARGKIVGWTRDFEQPAGYTGEFTIRSYLVGEVHAEWLDLDEGDDLVRTDRQGIIWDSDYGNALRKWGASLITEMGATSREPRRQRVKDLFLKASKIEDRAKATYDDKEIVQAVIALAEKIGGFAAEDELTDPTYIEELSKVIISVAPHTALMDAFREFEAAATAEGGVTLGELENLFSKTRIAELASYGQIAYERVRVIKKLERLVFEIKNEDEFQNLIADAPWLIEPTWSIISANVALTTFRDSLQHWLKQHRKLDVVLAIQNERKRPDFTLADIGRRLQIVEIKASGHEFNDNDCERLLNYVEAFDEFFDTHQEVHTQFPNGYQITLIADGENLKKPAHRQAFAAHKKADKVRRMPWIDFLMRTKNAHEQFLKAARHSAAGD